MVGDVGLVRRIEIAIGGHGFDGEPGGGAAGRVLARRVAAHAGEAASFERGHAVEAGPRVARRAQFDDAAQLAAELGRIPGRAHSHRLELVDAQRLGERGRAIVAQRDTVDHVLHLVFRPARMQDAVGFQQPAGLGGDQIDERPPGRGYRPIAQDVSTDTVDGRTAKRVENRIGWGRDIDHGAEPGQRQGHRMRDRQRRSHVHRRDGALESRARDLDTIDAERKVRRHMDAAGVDVERATDLGRVALQDAGRVGRRARRVADLDADLSDRALRLRQVRQQHQGQQDEHPQTGHSNHHGGSVNEVGRVHGEPAGRICRDGRSLVYRNRPWVRCSARRHQRPLPRPSCRQDETKPALDSSVCGCGR